MINIHYVDAKGIEDTARISQEPDLCPICYTRIKPIFFRAYKEIGSAILQIVYRCPAKKCDKLFISYYERHTDYFIFGFSVPRSVEKREFPENIQTLSGNFCNIYNQAYEAEKRNLTEICGAGYRKALEFLIKDYAIKKNEKDKVKISRMFLSNCINEYIEEGRIKSCAERATWLGNDAVHYYRTWEDKDLEDLKNLIELTVHWIELVLRSDEYTDEMNKPAPRTKRESSKKK